MLGTLLSTKKLSFTQQQLVAHSGVGYVHYDILKIRQCSSVQVPENMQHVIITSKNAIPALVGSQEHVKHVYCVGDVIAERLIYNGFTPKIIASDSQALAAKIIEQYPHKAFTYLCGDHRRDELPQLLKGENIPLEEVIVYESAIVEKSFDRIFAAVLFYSPRGVYAFAKANKHQPQCAICIGDTTAAAARKLYSNVLVAKKQTVENVLVTAINVLRDDKK